LLAADTRAELRLEQPSADAGTVKTGQALSHQFSFVNAGPAAVEITDVRASCGCLTPRVDRRVYQPGERGSLLLEVNTLTQPAGKHAWTIHVTCKSAEATHEVQAHLAAELVSEITVQPAALVLYTNKALEHDIVLTDGRPRPLSVAAVRASSPALGAEVIEQTVSPEGRALRRIRVHVADDFPEGRHDEIVAIYTDDLGYRELKVPVTVVKRSRQRVTAAPGEVRLVAPAGQAIPSRIVLLRDREGQPVVIEKIDAEDPAVVCTWASGPNAMATLRVRVERSRLRGPELQTTVHVHLSKPVADVLAIPVHCSAP
jgi:hypothetical protein